MAGSWSRRVTGDASLGRRKATSTNYTKRDTGSNVRMHSYDADTEQKVVIPLVKQGDNGPQPVIFSVPVHKVRINKSLQFKNKDGQVRDGFAIRSNHAYSQGTNYEDALTIAQRGDTCVISELLSLQSKKTWKDARAEFGEELGNLGETERKELAAFIKEREEGYFFKPSYYKASADGVIPARNVTETVILMLQYETVETIVTLPNGTERPTQTVKLDDNGQPIYKPVLFKLSEERAKKIQDAVDQALEQDVIAYEDLRPYTEFEGTADETQVMIGWLDLVLKWPSGSKMESGRNLSIRLEPTSKKILTPEIIADFETGEKGQEIFKSAKGLFFNLPSQKLRTRQEQIDALAEPVLRVYNELLEEFADEVAIDRANYKANVLDRIIAQNASRTEQESATSTSEGTTETVAAESAPTPEPEVEAEPVKEVKASSKASVQDLLNKVKNNK